MRLRKIYDQGFTVNSAELRKDMTNGLVKVIYLNKNDGELWFILADGKGDEFSEPERVFKVVYYGQNGEDDVIDYYERPMRFSEVVAESIAKQMEARGLVSWVVPF